MFNDLREWMIEADKLGELREVKGAHWDQEIGAVTDMINRKKNCPTVVPKVTKMGSYKIITTTKRIILT